MTWAGRLVRPALLLLVFAVAGCTFHPGNPGIPPVAPPPPTQPPPAQPPPPVEPHPETGIESFDRVQNGMTETQVRGAMGEPEEVPQESAPDYNLQWTVTRDGEEFVAFVQFRNGRVVDKRLLAVGEAE